MKVVAKVSAALCDGIVDGTGYLCREVPAWWSALRGIPPVGPTYVLEGTVRTRKVPWLFEAVRDTRGATSAHCLAVVVIVAGGVTLFVALPLAGLSIYLTSMSQGRHEH